MKKLKLTTLSEAILKDKESKAVLGGVCCRCSCYWEGTKGGASTDDNTNANYQLGTKSKQGCNQYSVCVEGDTVDMSIERGTDIHA